MKKMVHHVYLLRAGPLTDCSLLGDSSQEVLEAPVYSSIAATSAAASF